MRPALSVIISGLGTRELSWERMRECVEALRAQEAGPMEVLLCDAPDSPSQVIENVVFVKNPPEDRNARKTVAVRLSAAPIVAFVDASCVPHPGWARAILEAFEYYPEIAAVTGRLTGQKPAWFDRAFPGRPGPTRVLAASNVAYRREAYLEYPLPEGNPVEAVIAQSAAMRRAGYVLWYEPEVHVLRDRRGRKPPAPAVTGAGWAAQRG